MCTVLLQWFALHSQERKNAHQCTHLLSFAATFHCVSVLPLTYDLDPFQLSLPVTYSANTFLSLLISVLCRMFCYYTLSMGMETYGIVITCIPLVNTTFFFKENVSLQAALGPVPSCCNIEERTNLSISTSSSCPASPSHQGIPVISLSLFVEQHIVTDHCCILYTGHWWWRQW